MNRTLENFTKIKGSNNLTKYQCLLFGVKDVDRGWYKRYQKNEVSEVVWNEALKSLNSHQEKLSTRKLNKNVQYIYLMQSSNGLYKIGVSKDVEGRRRSLETGSGNEVKILSVWDTGRKVAYGVEQSAHRKFKQLNVRGEWFDLGESAVELFDSFLATKQVYGAKKVK